VPSLAAGLLVLGGAIYLGSRSPAPRPPRGAAHARLLPPSDPLVRRALEEVDRLRKIRTQRPVPMGGVGDPECADLLDRLRAASPELLSYLEELALGRGESESLRVDLLNIVARHRDDETRKFLASIVVDPAEVPAVRIAALEPLMKYRDPPTFEALKAAWMDPSPFPGRYHLCRALGENGNVGGIPLLREALALDQPLDLRSHAALGLGGFAEEPGVRDELKWRALGDPAPAVRHNAIRSLCRSRNPEIDGFLRDLAGPGTTDAETRRIAGAFLEERAKRP
jgi:HEAT repeat protein